MQLFPFPSIPIPPEIQITHLTAFYYRTAPPNFSFIGESHDHWELVYIDRGQIEVIADHSSYLLNAGEMIIHQPHEFHALQGTSSTSSNLIIVGFQCKASDLSCFSRRISILKNKEREYLYDALKSRHYVPGIFTEFSEVGAPLPVPDKNGLHNSPQIVRNNLELLILNLLSHGNSNSVQKRIESYSNISATRKAVKEIKEYLENHISEKLTLQQISLDLGYSIPQMKYFFAKETDASVIDYFIGLKLEEAKRLMQEGNLNIKQISESLGYSSLAFFSRQFAQREKITPSEYCRSFGETIAGITMRNAKDENKVHQK